MVLAVYNMQSPANSITECVLTSPEVPIQESLLLEEHYFSTRQKSLEFLTVNLRTSRDWYSKDKVWVDAGCEAVLRIGRRRFEIHFLARSALPSRGKPLPPKLSVLAESPVGTVSPKNGRDRL